MSAALAQQAEIWARYRGGIGEIYGRYREI